MWTQLFTVSDSVRNLLPHRITFPYGGEIFQEKYDGWWKVVRSPISESTRCKVHNSRVVNWSLQKLLLSYIQDLQKLLLSYKQEFTERILKINKKTILSYKQEFTNP